MMWKQDMQGLCVAVALLAAAAGFPAPLSSSALFESTTGVNVVFSVLQDRPVALWLFNATPPAGSGFDGVVFPSSTRTATSSGNKPFRTYTGPLAVRGAPQYRVPVGPQMSSLVPSSLGLHDGASYLEAPYSAVLNPTGDFTVEAWVRWTDNAQPVQYIASSSFSCNGVCATTGYALSLTTATKQLTFTVYDGRQGCSVTAGPAPFLTWLHIVASYTASPSGPSLILSLQASPGKTFSHAACASPYASNTIHPFRIGARTGPQTPARTSAVDSGFMGDIAALALYNHALIPTELDRMGVMNVDMPQ